MAWMEYFTVRSSTVYENKGLAKALLMTIALMIQRAEEGEEPTENEGWCFASERYLAESLGMSESRVCIWVEQFARDGRIVVESNRNARGHRHHRYRLTDNAMGRLEKLKRERGAERPKNLNKVRAGSIKNFLPRMVKKLVPVTALPTTHCSVPVDAKSGAGGLLPGA